MMIWLRNGTLGCFCALDVRKEFEMDFLSSIISI